MYDVIVTGRLGKAPTVRHFSSGKALTEFSIALYTGKAKNGQKNPVIWQAVKQWGVMNDQLLANLVKGAKVTASGRYDYETWVTKDGKKAERWPIIAEEIDIAGASTQYPINQDTHPPAPTAANVQQRLQTAQQTPKVNYDDF